MDNEDRVIRIPEPNSNKDILQVVLPRAEMRSRQIVIEVVSHGVYAPNSADPAKMEHAKYVKIIRDLAEAIAKSGC